MILYCCFNCPLVSNDCGPWDIESEIFKKIFNVHKNHPEFKQRDFVKQSCIEEEFNKYFSSKIDQLFHQLIVDLKGTPQSCLISHKFWREEENWTL